MSYAQLFAICTSPIIHLVVGNSEPSSLVGTCLTLPNLGFLWVFFKYPKISKNGNLSFFPVLFVPVMVKYMEKHLDIVRYSENEHILPVRWPSVLSWF